MLLFLFASLLVVVLLHDVPKKVFLVNQNGGAQAAVKGARPPWSPVSMAQDI